MDVSSESEKPVEVLKATFYQKATRWLWLQKDYRAYIGFMCDFKPTMLKSDVEPTGHETIGRERKSNFNKSNIKPQLAGFPLVNSNPTVWPKWPTS